MSYPDQLDDILYPPIEPYDSDHLIVGDGHRVYWEQSGNPDGKPVVFLHGGPGGGSSPWHRRFFDPEKYRIVLFDQRGCGRSTPHASESDADMRHNSTWHLVADIELLRRNLGIERWQVFGGSWGSALALAYAEAHPSSVTEIVLRGVFTLRPAELEWFYEGGAGAVFPDRWEGFLAPIPVLERSRMIDAYHRRLVDPDPEVHGPAAVAWTTWEASTLTLLPDPDLVAAMAEPEAATAFARIENHYFVNGGWFGENQLIDGAEALRDIPAVIVQGRYDVCTPMMTAWDLHRAWPEAEFVVVPDAGHAASEPGIARALRAATDRFAAAFEAGEGAGDGGADDADAGDGDAPEHEPSESEPSEDEPGDAAEADSAGDEPTRGEPIDGERVDESDTGSVDGEQGGSEPAEASGSDPSPSDGDVTVDRTSAD